MKNRVQIRHTSIEAGRIAANKVLNGQVGVANYHMTVRAYPHVVLRENKLATGAGADRVSSGMRQGFGKTVGTAARLERNQAILTVRVPAEKAVSISNWKPYHAGLATGASPPSHSRCLRA